MTTPESPPLAPRQSHPSEPRGGRRLRLVLRIALVLVVVIGGLAILLRPRPDGKRGPEAVSSPTAAPSPTVTPTPASDPQASDDVEAAFRAIHAKRTRAIVDRRPELIDEIYLPDCNCYELKSIVENSITRQAHHVGYDPEVVLIRRQETGLRGGNVASVQVVTQQGPYTVVSDKTGEVIHSDPGWAPQASTWNLFRNTANSPWKIGFLLVQGPADKVLGQEWRSAKK